MPFPRWLARFNRIGTNRVLIRLAGLGSFAALTHRGRRSGQEYRIPVNAFPCRDGFVVALTYGPSSDWVRNVLAAGGARLEYRREVHDLGDPEFVDRAVAFPCIPAWFRAMLRLLQVHEYLIMR